MRRTSKLMVLVVALAAAPAVAHETAARAMGVVQSVTPERIVIRAADGHAISYAVTPETRFFRGDKPARADDVRVGERAVVQGKPAGEGFQAVRVKLPPRAPAAK